MRSFIAIAAALVGLSACASLSKDECLTADWRTLGYQDGARGASADAIGGYRKSCAKHGVTPDLQAYLYGRDEGLRTFCRPQRGFVLGSGGASYLGVCPADLEGPFLSAYNDGHGLYVRRQAVASLADAIEHKRRRIEEIDHHLLVKGAELISDDVSVEDRAHLLIDIKSLTTERDDLQRDIPSLEQDHAAAVRDLQAYEGQLSVAAL